jgi:hypothetical protein
MSRYYQGYQPQQRRQQDFSELERMRLEQQQRQQQSQSQQGDNMNGMGKLAKMFNSGGGETIPSGGGQSFGGGNSAYGGIDIPASTGGAEMPAGESWYSNLFSGGEGAAGGGSSMTAAAAPVAMVLAANTAHNKGISPWHETLKGRLAGNTIDYYQGKQDGKEHGFMSKVLDDDGAFGNFAKSATDFAELDFSNSFDNAKTGLKNLFKLKLF